MEKEGKMKEYIDNLITNIVFILVGLAAVYYGFQPDSSTIPIIIAFWGILGVAGVFAVLAGVIGIVRAIRNIFRHYFKKVRY